jgi:protein TonB
MNTVTARSVGMVLVAILLIPIATGQQPNTASEAALPTVDVVAVQTPPMIMIKGPRVRYPPAAHGVAGWVRVECMVSPEGRCEGVRAVASEPAGVFEQAAIDAMKYARFKPCKTCEPRLMTQRILFDPS